MGVTQVRSPSGDTWWVKRAWVPRYRGLRDRVGAYLEGHPERWYEAPLRVYARGWDRRVLDAAPDPLDLAASAPWPGAPTGALDASSAPDPLDAGGGSDLAGDFSPDLAQALGLDVGGGSGLPGDFSPDLAQAPDLDVGGGGDLTGAVDVGTETPSSTVDLGGGGGLDSVTDDAGGGGVDVDPGDLVVVLLAVLAVLALLVLAWFVLLPFVLVVVDGLVLLLAVLLAGAARVLLRRPWDVVATQDRPDGSHQVRRWELRGYRRAGRARDDVARAFETGTDADLAVARLVVREPRPDDPAGVARSARELRRR